MMKGQARRSGLVMGLDTHMTAGSRACTTSTRLTHPIITNETTPHFAETLCRPRREAGETRCSASCSRCSWVAGTTHAFLLRRRVFAPSPTQPALAAALAARQRRAEARAIASRDAALAQELRIGRPDLPRQFDDGGLVDVNHVPAQVLVDQLGLSRAQAGQVVEARDRLGGFAGPEELIAYTELSPEAVDGLREHLVFFAVE